MDKNLQVIIKKRVDKVIDALEKNNMDGYFVNDEKEAIEKIKDICHEGETVAVGGSISLAEVGVLDLLRNGKYNFLDRYKEGLTPEQIEDVFRKSFFADTFFTGSNAITEEGFLYNVDGKGNRVAAMLYGPKKVVVVVGINKIVSNVEEAEVRMQKIAAPANCVRLNKTNPCTVKGECMNCSSKTRICNLYTVIKRQMTKGRISVIIVNKQLGY